MNIVNGHTGTAHISGSDLRSLLSGLVGDGAFVVSVGEQLSASMTTANNCRVLDGDLICQGVHSRIIEAAYEDLTITNGAVGYNRKDIVAWHYERDGSTQVESVELVVIAGTAVVGTAADPDMPAVGVLRDGDLEHYEPLYRISLSGLTVSAPVLLAEKIDSINGRMVNLFDNEENGNGSVSLSETSANFKRLYLNCKTNDGIYFTAIAERPNGRLFNLLISNISTSNNAQYLKSRTVLISGTTIATAGTDYCENSLKAGDGAYSHVNQISIVKVDGER